MQQASSPPSHCRWVRRPRRICDVRNGSFPGATRLVQQFPRLLSAMEGVVPRRRRPVGQHCKRLSAWRTPTPANADLVVPLVMGMFEPLAVTDDRPLAANRAQPRQQLQRDLGHPGSVFSSDSGSAIKRTTAYRRPAACCPAATRPRSWLSRYGKSGSNEERILLSARQRTEPSSTWKIGRFSRPYRSVSVAGPARRYSCAAHRISVLVGWPVSGKPVFRRQARREPPRL